MFKINKDEEYVYVEVNVPKRKVIKDKKIRIYWVDALNEAKRKHPELDLESRPDHKGTVNNYSDDNSTTWKFRIVKRDTNINSHKKNKNRNRKGRFFDGNMEEEKGVKTLLTHAGESVTVEETEQSGSDQYTPAIVQEPTE